MFYDFSVMFIWALLAFVVGVVSGWMSYSAGRQTPWFHGWFRWSIILFAVGLVVAWLHWLPGRLGFELETALILYASYIFGCLFGGVLHGAVKHDDGGAAKAATAGAGAAAAAAGLAKSASSSAAVSGSSSAQPIVTASDAAAAKTSAASSNAAASTATSAPQSPAAVATATPQAPAASSAAPRAAAVVESAAVASVAADTGSVSAPAASAPSGATAPALLTGARDGRPDDLTRIQGLSGRDSGRLNALGVWHYDQIANWSGANAAWADSHLGASGRVESENWIGQAKALASAPVAAAVVAASAAAPAPQAPASAVAPAVAKTPVHKPDIIASLPGQAQIAGERPLGLTGAIDGEGDDLTRIASISSQDAWRLRSAGIWHFAQIANWSDANSRWIDGNLSAPGRVEHENWVKQARGLVEHGGSPVRDLAGFAPVAAVVAAPVAASVDEPAAMGRVEGEEKHGGQRPVGLVSARGGKPDDLKRIKGIGPQNEGRLHALGIWHFAQIAQWTHENVQWVGSYLAFPGRIDREEWIAQATELAKGGETAFSKRVERGEVASSHVHGTAGQANVADLSKIKPRT